MFDHRWYSRGERHGHGVYASCCWSFSRRPRCEKQKQLVRTMWDAKGRGREGSSKRENALWDALHQANIEADLVPLNNCPLDLAEGKADGLRTQNATTHKPSQTSFWKSRSWYRVRTTNSHGVPLLRRFFDEVVHCVPQLRVRAGVPARSGCARGSVSTKSNHVVERVRWFERGSSRVGEVVSCSVMLGIVAELLRRRGRAEVEGKRRQNVVL